MKFVYYCVFILLISSCNNKKTDATEEIDKPMSSRIKKHAQIATIKSKFQVDIDAWTEYENLIVFLNQYMSISPNDALNNSRELNDITKSLNDSIKPQFLETPAFKARVNLLYNETLRLYDMSSIPAIKATEVNNQIDKVLNAFSSINFKINTILKQRELEGDVKDVNFSREVVHKKLIKDPEIKTLKPLLKEKLPKKKVAKKTKKMMFFEDDLLKKKKNSLRKRKKVTKKKDN